MQFIFSATTVALLVVFIVMALMLALRPQLKSREIADRTRVYVERSGPDDPTEVLRDLHGSFMHRMILPGVRNVLGTLGRLAPAHTLEALTERLTIAGRPGNLTAADFLGICILLSVVGLILGLVVRANGEDPTYLLRPVAGCALGFMLPRFWLSSRCTRRQETIQHSLPDALDMLTICVEAGLAFESAMQRVSERWPGPLADEFARTIAEIRLGVSRSQALRRMADRCGTPDVSSFVAILVQADSMGTSIALVLHSQADQMRVMRRQRAEEKANKAPIKVMIPMVLFIFPALFVVILGPGVPMILEAFSEANR